MKRQKKKVNKKEQTNGNSLQALAAARSKYKEQGDPTSCGDWLAEALKGFDHQSIAAVLKENKLEEPKIDMDRPGAIGRARMVNGLRLRALARKQGFILINGKKVSPESPMTPQTQNKPKQGRKKKAAAESLAA